MLCKHDIKLNIFKNKRIHINIIIVLHKLIIGLTQKIEIYSKINFLSFHSSVIFMN
jgi:hypothetical protein